MRVLQKHDDLLMIFAFIPGLYKMKMMFRSSLFHLLLCCVTQALGVRIQSVPEVSSEGVIQTELKRSVTLLCLHDGGSETQAEEELVWLRNGAVVSLKEENKKGRSSVCVTPVLHEDNGATFTCHLSRNATVRASTSHSSLDQRKLQWKLNQSSSCGGFTVTKDGFTTWLTAHKAERALHEGTYQCTAHSPLYGEYSKSFPVTVTEKTMKFPLMPMIAGLVVVSLTAILAVFSRWDKITKCCK
ncbi:hypothetical protein INR49_027801 [Caranx melampygus]|nr:hypothetical protein INR49_027801 [Caranx melampygus]